MVIAGRSVHLTTLFLGKLEQAVNQYFVHILSLVTDKLVIRISYSPHEHVHTLNIIGSWQNVNPLFVLCIRVCIRVCKYACVRA